MAGDAPPVATPPARADSRALSRQTWVAATFILVFTTLVSKALGFVRDVLIANYFGTSTDVDAFVVATTLSAVAGGIGSALAAAFVPVYRRTLAERGTAESRRLAGGAVGLTLVLTAFAAFILFSFPRHLVGLVAPALPAETTELAAELIRWLVGLMLGINLIYILSAVYNALEHFMVPSITDLASNLIVLLALVVFAATLGIRAVAIGLGAGTLVVAAAMAVPLLRQRIVSGAFHLGHPLVGQLGVLAAPVFAWEVVSQAGTMVENFFGAKVGPGSIAALGYARRVSVLVVSLLAVNIARAVFPVLTRFISEGKIAEARDLMLKLSRQYLVAFVPLSVALMYFREHIIALAFVRGAFDAAAAAATASVLLYYAAGIFLLAAIPICIRACYAFADTRTPLFANLLALVMMVGLNVLMAGRLGVSGVALSTSVSLFISVGIMGSVLRARFRGLALTRLGTVGVLAALCAGVAVLPVAALRQTLPGTASGIVGLLVGVVVYAISYYLLGWFLMRTEVRTLWSLLRSELHGANQPR